MAQRPIFIDIDGTLTDLPLKPWGNLIPGRVEHIRRLVAQGYKVVIWSGGGTRYAQEFVKKIGIDDIVTAIGKPEMIVDDDPGMRPKDRMKIISPDEFFK